MTDHNNHKGGYGRISVEQAIWYSSNIGVAKTILKGYEKNPTKYVEGLYRIGLNEDLRLEIPGAGRAKIRRPDDTVRYWSKTALPWMSFGYETQIPPIYTLAFYNAIANNGKMVRPIFTKEILHNGKTVQSFSTEVVRESICSERTLNMIKDMLLGVVEKEPARPSILTLSVLPVKPVRPRSLREVFTARQATRSPSAAISRPTNRNIPASS